MKNKARMAFYLFLVVAAGVVAVLLRGLGDPGLHLYKRAESLLSSGDYESAVVAYGEVVERFPGSRWADNSLYKQGFILSSFLGRWSEAVEAYEKLAQRPKSDYRDDGLFELARIHETALVQPDQALSIYRRLVDEYGHASDLVPDAEVGIARCLVQEGDPAAFAACEKVIREHPDSPDLAAEAEYLLARAYQTISNQPEEAIKRYNEVAEKYQSTPWAAKAKNELGWHFYQSLKEHEGARVLLELPGAGDTSWSPGSSLVSPVFATLLGSGIGLSAEGFAGLSGEAFRFFYFPESPAQGAETFYRQPFSAVCELLGLPYYYQESQRQDEARQVLKTALFQGHPVVTSVAGPPPGWYIVIGSDAERGEIYIHDPFTKYRAYGSKNFTARWGSDPAPRIVLAGKGRASKCYPIFFVKDIQAKQNLKDATTSAIKMALQDLKRESPGGGGYASFQAYQALIDRLQVPEDQMSAEYLTRIAEWNASGAPNLISCRRAAAAFLNETAASFSPKEQRYLRYAAEDYATEATILQRARELLPTTGTMITGLESEKGRVPASLAERLLKASGVLQDALQYEHSAVSNLSEAMAGQ